MIDKRIIFRISIITLLLSTILISCKNPNNDDNPGGVNLTGNYGRYVVSQMTYMDLLVFTESTFSTQSSYGPVLSGGYKYDGATLTLTISGVKHNKYANLNGTTLVITGDGAYSEFFNGTWVQR